MPVVHPYVGGAAGIAHGSNYEIVDPVAACVASAKMQMAMLLLLLRDDSRKAKQIIAEFRPLFTSKQAFLSYVDSLQSVGDRIEYHGENIAQVRL